MMHGVLRGADPAPKHDAHVSRLEFDTDAHAILHLIAGPSW